ncbi:MAG: hypothetical protein SGBAC_013324 [Bacillariaceae sp.]
MTDQMTTPDSIVVSGVISEPGLNGEYFLNGTFRGDKLQWMKPMSRCYIRFIRDRWELYVSHHPSGTTYFHHSNVPANNLPPTSGYLPAPCSGPDEVLSLEFKHQAPPTSKYRLYTNKACPFAQQVHIVMQELGIDDDDDDDDSLQSEQQNTTTSTKDLKLVEAKVVDIFSKNDVDFINSYHKAYPSKTQRPAIPLLVGLLSLPGNNNNTNTNTNNEHVAIAESRLIVEYLMDQVEIGNNNKGEKSKLAPSSPLQKAQVGIFVHAVNREIFPCINAILNSSNLERLDTAVDKLMEGLGCIETMLKRSDRSMEDESESSSSNNYFLGSDFSLAEAKTAPCFQRLLLLAVPELRPELGSARSLRQFHQKKNGGGDPAADTILLCMIRAKYPAVSKWLASSLQHPSVVATFHKEDVTEVLQRARVTMNFDMPADSSVEELAFTQTKRKMEDLFVLSSSSRKMMSTLQA